MVESMSQGDYKLLMEKLQVRGQNFVALLRCPVTGSPLVNGEDGLISEADTSLIYRVEQEIVELLTDEQATQFAAEEASLESSFQSRGIQPPSEIVDFRRLPQSPLPTWPATYWQNRADVTAEMWRFLEYIRRDEERLPIGPMGTAADLSEGMGWVGYGLDVSGYNTIVVSQYRGTYGLGVFPYSRYLRVHGSVSAPPLAPDSFDLVVFSFSLEKLDSPTEALQNASELLKARGTLLVLSDDKIDADAAMQTLSSVGLHVQKLRVRGLGGQVGRALKLVLGRSPNVPPIIAGRRL